MMWMMIRTKNTEARLMWVNRVRNPSEISRDIRAVDEKAVERSLE